MSLEANREALRNLDVLTKRLHELVQKRAEGARFQRAEERSAAFLAQVTQATGHVKHAIDELEGRAAAPAQDEPPPRPSSWLSEHARGVVDFLCGRRTTSEEDEAPAPLGAGVVAGDARVLGVAGLLDGLKSEQRSGVLRVVHPSETLELHVLYATQ